MVSSKEEIDRQTQRKRKRSETNPNRTQLGSRSKFSIWDSVLHFLSLPYSSSSSSSFPKDGEKPGTSSTGATHLLPSFSPLFPLFGFFFFLFSFFLYCPSPRRVSMHTVCRQSMMTMATIKFYSTYTRLMRLLRYFNEIKQMRNSHDSLHLNFNRTK